MPIEAIPFAGWQHTGRPSIAAAIQTLPLGICGGVEDAAVASRAGADDLEASAQRFLVPAGADAARFNLFLPGSLAGIGPEVDAGYDAAI